MKTEERSLQDLKSELTEQDLDQLKGGSNANYADAMEDRDQEVTKGSEDCCNTSW